MNENTEYRRAWMDLHHVAQLFQSLPYKINLTPEQLQSTATHLQRTFRDLESIYQSLDK